MTTRLEQAQIAFVGGGNMARALIAGLLRQGVARAQLAVGEPSPAQREHLQRELGIAVQADNAAAVAGATLIVLAVKPQEMRAVLTALAPRLRAASPLLVSIAAGLRVADLARWCPAVPLVRAMPNRPALAGAGITGLYAPSGTTDAQRSLAEALMQSAGSTVWVREESQLDIVTALSGSGPAYFFLLAELMAEAGARLGLPREVARRLAAETLHGAGQLAHGADDLAGQREAVTSKGGTTAAALQILQSGEFARLVDAAMAAATRRGAELSAQLGSDAA